MCSFCLTGFPGQVRSNGAVDNTQRLTHHFQVGSQISLALVSAALAAFEALRHFRHTGAQRKSGARLCRPPTELLRLAPGLRRYIGGDELPMHYLYTD